MEQRFDIDKLERHYQKVLLYAPGMMGNIAVNFFLDRFKDQAWIGNVRQPWAARKVNTKWGPAKRNKGRAILIDKGALRRATRITKVTAGEVHIGNNMPYARAHNEGMRLGLIQKVRGYQRSITKFGTIKGKSLKTRSKLTYGRVDTGKRTAVASHTRKVNMKLPQRQFMGYSPYLQKMIERKLMAEFMKGQR